MVSGWHDDRSDDDEEEECKQNPAGKREAEGWEQVEDRC